MSPPLSKVPRLSPQPPPPPPLVKPPSQDPAGFPLPSPLKSLAGEVPMAGYGPYLGSVGPLPPHYPPQKALDMRQSFVDYLWGSRSGLPSLGLSYPLGLPFPKRPLPSFPTLGLTSPDPRGDSVTEHRNTEISDCGYGEREGGLRSAPASAFTPVSRPSSTPSPPQKGERAPLPDSSRGSDDEAVDVENTEDEEPLPPLSPPVKHILRQVSLDFL